MKITIRLDGKEKVIARVKEITGEQLVAVDAALWDVAGRISMQAKNNCRTLFDHPTGRLMGSITMASTWDKKTSPSAPAKEGDAVSKPVESIKHVVSVGTNVEYARRIEFGFIGKDSLGRSYNQAAKPYLFPAFFAHETTLKDALKKAFRRKPESHK